MMRKLPHGQTRKYVSLIEEKQRELQGKKFRDAIGGSQRLRPCSLDHRLGPRTWREPPRGRSSGCQGSPLLSARGCPGVYAKR